MYETHRDRLLHLHLADFVVPGYDFAEASRQFRAAKSQRGEFDLLLPDGSRKLVEYSARADFLPGRHLTAMRDITSRKRIEAELRERSEFQRALLENFPNGSVMVFDRDLTYVLAEGRRLAELGIAPGQLVGTKLGSLLDAPQTDKAITQYRRVLAGESVKFELFHGGRDLQINAVPLYDTEGRVANVLAVAQDITERKESEAALRRMRDELEARVDERTTELAMANEHLHDELLERARTEEALRSAQQMLQLVINQIPQAIFWKDTELRYLGGNYRLALDAGCASPEELIGKTDFDMPWAAMADLYRADDLAVMQSDTPKLGIEETIIRADASTAWLRTSKIPLHDRDNKVVGVLASYEDITERKQAEAAIIEARREADAANLAKSEFLSRMSHELRTPLNAILGFGQILDKQVLNEVSQESVGYILKSGRHLLDLINEVLDISRVEAGRIELSLEPIALDDVIPDACAMVSPLAAERGIRLIEDTAALSGLYVLADRQRLKQVLINLLSNGIKYNREHGQVEVNVSPRPDGLTRIAIRDTGPGIAPADMAKLFTPFERLNAVASDIEGTGLGLALSQRLVMAMGGRLDVESTLGRGTTLIIELPAASPPEKKLETASTGRVAVSAPKPNGRMYSVLCVEDNPSNLRLLEVILQVRPDIRLLSAVTGLEGLDLARKHEPDLILLDLNLPDIGGRDVLARLRQSALTRDIPVVVVSADATPNQVQRLLQAGASDYLTKPFDVDYFLHILDRMLNKGDGAVEHSADNREELSPRAVGE